MDYPEYIDKRIENLKQSNRTFKRIIFFFICFGILLIIIASTELVSIDNIIKYSQFIFGILSMIFPLKLNDSIAKRKSQILDLEFLKSKIQKDSTGQIGDDILKQILGKL